MLASPLIELAAALAQDFDDVVSLQAVQHEADALWCHAGRAGQLCRAEGAAMGPQGSQHPHIAGVAEDAVERESQVALEGGLRHRLEYRSFSKESLISLCKLKFP